MRGGARREERSREKEASRRETGDGREVTAQSILKLQVQYSSCWVCAMCPVVVMDEDPPVPESGGGPPQASCDPQGSGDSRGDPPSASATLAIWGGGDHDLQTISPLYPALIRIGPSRHNYMYHLQTNSPLYRCIRASDWGGSNDRLWLFRDSGSLP